MLFNLLSDKPRVEETYLFIGVFNWHWQQKSNAVLDEDSEITLTKKTLFAKKGEI